MAVWLTTFAAIQTNWSDQWRIILPYVPYFLIAFFGALWYKAKSAKPAFLKPVLIIVLLIFVLVQLPLTSDKVSANSSKLKHFLKGDMRWGIPDPKAHIDDQWEPFVAICDSVKYKVPATAMIGTRSPGEAFVYSGFSGFQRISNPGKNESVDTVLAHLKKQGITHLLVVGMNNPINTAEIIASERPDKIKTIMPTGYDFNTWLQEYARYMQYGKSNPNLTPPEQPVFLLEIKY